MSSPEWTRQKKIKLIDLYRQAPILWARKGQKIHPRQRSNALQQIADEIGVNVLEVEKKLHVLRSQFMRERKRIQKSQLNGDEEIYQSHWQYYKKLEFLSGLVEPSHMLPMGAKANPNTSEGESSNQSASKDETGEGTDDIYFADIPTQLNRQNKQECLSEAPSVLPDDVSSNSFPREDQCFQNPDDSSFTNRHDELIVAEDDTSDGVDFPSGGIDDTLVSFGNYLISLLRGLPLHKSYQLQQKFISETMNTTIQFEKERIMFLQKKRKNETNQIHDRLYVPTPSGSRLEHSRVDGQSKKGIPNRNNTSDPLSISQKIGQALQPNKVYSSGGGHNLDGGNRVTPGISIEMAAGVSEGSEIHSEDNRVMCVQCDVCKELFRTSAELKRHQAAKHPEGNNESLGKEEVTSKRPRLEDGGLEASPMSSTFIIPGHPNSSASDRSH